jgi:hypothetical protein
LFFTFSVSPTILHPLSHSFPLFFFSSILPLAFIARGCRRFWQQSNGRRTSWWRDTCPLIEAAPLLTPALPFTAENGFLKEAINSALRKRHRFNIQVHIFDLVLGCFLQFCNLCPWINCNWIP